MRGGYRKNAGRKTGFSALRAQEARRQIAEMVSKEILPITQALIEKAKKGDVVACRELFDRAWGRTTQSLTLESPYIFSSKIEETRKNTLSYLWFFLFRWQVNVSPE